MHTPNSAFGALGPVKAQKACCNHDCAQSDNCPVRALRKAQKEQAQAARLSAEALACKSSDWCEKTDTEYVFSSVRVALLIYAIVSLATFIYLKLVP